MALRARYDPKADRMQLLLDPGQAPADVFVLNRRQWLGLLYRVRVVAQQMGVALAVPPASTLPRSPAPRVPPPAAREPVVLDGIRLRAAGEGVRLTLVTGEQGRSLNLPSTALTQLDDLLVTQADRAGWDARAALQRLQADALTRAALTKYRT